MSGSVIETNRSYSSAGIASLYPHSHPHSMSNSHIHPSGNGHGAGKGGSEHYSFELKDLDEAVESSLVDPSTSGSLFTRLLVKTVGVLSCEVPKPARYCHSGPIVICICMYCCREM